VKSTTTTIEKGRKTKQGLTDLNYYGPRRVKEAAVDPAAAAAADGEAGQEARPTATAPVEPPAEGALTK